MVNRVINRLKRASEYKSINDKIDICLDWEVLPNYFNITFLEYNPKTKTVLNKITFTSNPFDDKDTFNTIKALYNYIKDKHSNSIFIAWNVNYDKTIMYEFLKEANNILNKEMIASSDFNQRDFNKTLFEKSKEIVTSKEETLTFLDFSKYGFNDICFYDAMKYMTNPVSLKVSAGESGFSMLESNIPWDKEHLTKEDVKTLIKYNKHDVDVLFRMLLKYYDYYQIRKDLVEEFSPTNHKYIEYKNNAFFNLLFKLSKKDKREDLTPTSFNFYKELEKRNNPLDKENDLSKLKKLIEYIETNTTNKELLYILKRLKEDDLPLDGKKYEIIFTKDKNPLFGMDGIFALGGIHASKDALVLNNIKAVMKDVASYYPNGLINYNLQSRAIKEEQKDVLIKLKNDRLRFKYSKDKNLKKKDKTYKVIINGYYGLLRANIANIVDLTNGALLCILGQILLIYLCELIEPYVEEFIQLNTDGIYYVPKDNKEEKINSLCKEWEKLTEFELETDKSIKTFNFNVNNYILEFDTGKLKIKGRYINQYDNDILDSGAIAKTYDLNIISKLIVNLLIYKKSFNDTLKENPELWRYQSVKKISKSYDNFITYNGEEVIDISKYTKEYNLSNPIRRLTLPKIEKHEDKVMRFFAVKQGQTYYKYKKDKGFLNTELETTLSLDNITTLVKQPINHENVLLLFKQLKAKKYTTPTYKLETKTYLGEKIAGISESSYVYNHPLFNNYENKYQLTKEDIKTIADFERETNKEIDLEWYKAFARDLMFNVYKLEDKIKPFIYNLDTLIK